MTLRIATITIDCANPQALAHWWADALGWSITYDSPDEVVIEAPEGEIASPLLFGQGPDDKVVKNRLHIDLRPDDRDAEVARLEGLGARRVDIGQGPDVKWVVMADPENNEFCVLRALRPDELADS